MSKSTNSLRRNLFEEEEKSPSKNNLVRFQKKKLVQNEDNIKYIVEEIKVL